MCFYFTLLLYMLSVSTTNMLYNLSHHLITAEMSPLPDMPSAMHIQQGRQLCSNKMMTQVAELICCASTVS